MDTTFATRIKDWGRELGFQQVGISDGNTGKHAAHLARWLHQHFHGEMAYMKTHQDKRESPSSLLPETIRVISVRLDYLSPNARIAETLQNDHAAYVSRYALGRDYHKLIRKRLSTLAKKIQEFYPDCITRAFADSAPVLEKAHAENAGLGFIGKHTNLINRQAGSWFFLGELFINLPLPVDTPTPQNHCGKCTACITVCPTQAIVAPYQLDARRCISYLTIELKDDIPEEFRSMIGNRIYGCDDCQLVCPWNRFAKVSVEPAFHARHGLDTLSLIDAFAWSEEDFIKKTEGSAIARIGYLRWLRNVAVALGNATPNDAIVNALRARENHESDLVRTHVAWALKQQNEKTSYPY